MQKREELQVLLASDRASDAAAVTAQLRLAGFVASTHAAHTLAELEAALRERRWDMVVAADTANSPAQAALLVTRAANPQIPCFLLADVFDEAQAVAGLRAGAADLLTRGRLERLAPAVAEALRAPANLPAPAPAEARLTTTLDSLLEGAQIIGFDWRYLYINEAAAAQGRRAPADLLGRTMMEVYPGIEQAPFFAVLQRAMTQRQPARFESEFLNPDGERGWFDLSMEPVPEGVFILSIDNTAHRVLQLAQRESQVRLAGVINSAMDAILTVDADQRITLFNAAAENMFGYTWEEMRGQPLDRLLPERFRTDHREHIRRFGQTGTTTRHMGGLNALSALRADGREFPIEAAISQVEVAGQKLYTVILRDVSERQEAERALRAATERLAVLADASRDFVEAGLDTASLLNKVAGKVAEALGDNSTIALVSEDGEWLEMVAAYSTGPDAESFVRAAAATGRLRVTDPHPSLQVLRTGEPLLMPEVSTERLRESVAPERLEAAARFAIRSALAVVLRAQGRNLGVLTVTRSQANRPAFGEADVHLAQNLADRAALALAHARLFQQLEAHEERFRQLAENIQQVFWMEDTLADRLLYVSPAYADVFGQPVETLYADRYAFLAGIAPEDRERIWQAQQRQRAGERTVYEVRCTRPDGQVRWVMSRAFPILDDQGQVYRVAGLSEDITERKRFEETLARAEAEYRALVEQLPAITYRSALDELGSTLYISPQAATLGYTPAEHQADPTLWFQRIHPDDRTLLAQANAKLIHEDRANLVEYRVRHRNGQEVWVADLGVLVRDAAGEPLYVQGVVLDISARKLAEAEVQRQLDRLGALRAIDIAITASQDLRLTLAVLLDQVTAQLRVDAAAVLLLDPVSHVLTYGAGRGFRTRGLEQTRLRVGEGHAGLAALERRVVEVPNLQAALPRFGRAALLKDEGFAHYVGAPLIAKGKVIGLLELYHRSSLGPDPAWSTFLEALAGQAAIAIENASMFDSLQRLNADLLQAYEATIEGWSRAVDLRDHDTEGHSQRVADLTLQIARALLVPEEDLVHIRRGALLHDIGKIGVPDAILHKPGPLSDDEWVVMKQHPTFAHELLAPIYYLKRALDIPYCHHEKWDGSGYPRGLVGEQIPMAARLFAVVDVWDALCSERPYRAAWPAAKALAHIRSLSGTHFDPRAVEAFEAAVGQM